MSEIFLINEGETLVPLSQRAYESEDLLQTLLEKYPSLLAGDQINPKTPRRWLLVKREADVPGQENGGGRWFLDHLFLDQEGIPTLVEVKRSTDTRIRREVVGQMLDYAANGVKYWPIESLRSHFESTCEIEGVAPETKIAELIAEGDQDEFWLKVKTNLQAGRIRMLFVADEIPDELRRVVEFLNEQMDPAEVLAVEIKQYANAQVKTLVPRIIGLTAEAEDRKRVGERRTKRKWDEASFFETLRLSGDQAMEAAGKLLNWAKRKSLRIAWGEGVVNGSVDRGGINNYTFFQFQPQAKQWPFEKLRELANRLNKIPDVDIRDGDLARYPSIPLNILADEESMKLFLEAWQWMLEEIDLSADGPAGEK
ncbi:MAG: hypothetical protein WD490_07025 [Opitutales bacterium]